MPAGDRPRGPVVSPPAQPRPRVADEAEAGNILALEAVLAMAVVSAAIVYVVAASGGMDPHQETTTDSDLRRLVGDALQVLDLGDGAGTPATTPLTQLVGEAIQGRPGLLEDRVERLLPRSAEFDVHLDNGDGTQVLVEGGGPGDDSVEETRAITPSWPGVVVVPDLRVYPSGDPANMTVTAVPHLASRSPDPLEGVDAAYENGFVAPLEDTGTPAGTAANGSVPNASAAGGDGYPTDTISLVEAEDVVGDHVLAGVAPYRTLAQQVVADAHEPARSGLDEAWADVDPSPIHVGDEVTVTWNMTPVADAVSPHTTNGTPDVGVALYPPVPRTDPDAAVDGPRSERGLPQEGSWTHRIPRGGIEGRWTAVVALNYTLDAPTSSLNQSARLVETFFVGPAGGGDPSAVTYDVEVVAWYPDQ